MSRGARTTTPAGRDAALRRLRRLNRVLIGAAVAATGLLADVAAQAFPGHRRAATPIRQAASPAGSVAHADGAHGAAAHQAHHHHHRRHRRLRAPTQSPAAAPAQTAPAQTATVQAAPVQTTPAPVVSGGS
ncbi:MAG: hypothetical protein ACRDMJ_07660 [Solirubrobacteraceae bacterium]